MKGGTYHPPCFRGRPAHAVGVVVQHGVLDHGSEDKQEADGDKEVHGCHVGDPGQ